MYEYGDILVMKDGFTCKVVFVSGTRITIEIINDDGIPERHSSDVKHLRKPVKVIHDTRQSERE